MKTTILLLTSIGTIVGSLSLLSTSAQAASGGTDILHLSVRKAASPSETSSNAVGQIELQQNRQGHADNQKLRVRLGKLEADTGHLLFAWLGDDTNATYVAAFNSDEDGDARLDYSSIDSRRGHGRSRGHDELPIALKPLSNVRSLMVTDASTQAVLRADLTLPDKLQYLVKRSLTTNDVEPSARGYLHLHSTVNWSRVKVTVAGLTATNDYLLALDDGVVMSATSDKKGRVEFRGALELPADILDVRSLAIWNSSSNVVLSTTLP